MVAGAAVVVGPAVRGGRSPPQAATRPPRPAPTPTAAPATPAIFKNSRRLTVFAAGKVLLPSGLSDR